MTRAWTRWQDWVKVGLGARWVLGTAANAASSWNAWIVAAIVAGPALAAVATARQGKADSC